GHCISGPSTSRPSFHESSSNRRPPGASRRETDPSHLLLQLSLQRDASSVVRPHRPRVLDRRKDVREGRKHLNFSEVGNLPPAQQKAYLYESVSQIELG